jgi:hypothetical protein
MDITELNLGVSQEFRHNGPTLGVEIGVDLVQSTPSTRARIAAKLASDPLSGNILGPLLVSFCVPSPRSGSRARSGTPALAFKSAFPRSSFFGHIAGCVEVFRFENRIRSVRSMALS